MNFCDNTRDGLLIQQACGAQQPMLALTASHHARYCIAHGFDYKAHFGKVELKAQLLLDAYRAGYDYIVILDADTLIVDTSRDLRDACSDEGVSCCRHSGISWPYGQYDHLNIGAVYAERTSWLEDAAGRWLNTDSHNHQWGEQHAFHLLDCPKREIGCEWNSCGHWKSENPIVRAWHGEHNCQYRFEQIAIEMALRGLSTAP